MINIPTTDIMTLMTGDIDRTAVSDGPQSVETSFLGVMSAGDGGTTAPADIQADVFGALLTADLTQSAENPERSSVTAAFPAIILAQNQKDAFLAVPASYPPASNGTSSPAHLPDANPYVVPQTIPVTFGADQAMELDQPVPLLPVEGVSPQTQKITAPSTTPAPEFAVAAQIFPQTNISVAQLMNAQPVPEMLADEIDASQKTPEIAQVDPIVSDDPSSRLQTLNAKNPTPIALVDRSKPEMVALSKPDSTQQFAAADQPSQPHTSPISGAADLRSSQRLQQSIAEQAIPLAPASAEKALATQTGTAFSQSTSEISTGQRISALGAAPAADPAKMSTNPIEVAVAQAYQQRLDAGPVQSINGPQPLRQPLPQLAGSALQPPLRTTDKASETIPQNRQSTAFLEGFQYGNGLDASSSGKPSETESQKITQPSALGSQTTQPQAPPKVVSAETVQPPVVPKNDAFVTSQPPAAPEVTAINATQQPAVFAAATSQSMPLHANPKAAMPEVTQTQTPPKATTVETNKTKAAQKSPTPTVELPKSPPLAGTPETNGGDAVDLLITPEFAALEARSFDTAPLVRHDSTLNRPEVMRHVAQQLTDVARQMPDRPVELALNPEELGRLRLTFTTTDAGLHVAVIAERGETMDLLRRHIESLAQDFRELGYRDVKFDFSGNGARSDADTSTREDTDQENNASPNALSQDSVDPIKLSLEPSTGLDLRL